MISIPEAMREVLGEAPQIIEGSVDYGALAEYVGGIVLLCIVVFSIFKILVRAFGSN